MAAVAAGAAPKKRIRDFLRLAKNNPNPHEAKLAYERASDLLQRYGLTEADVEEQATEDVKVNPGKAGNQREELARVVAKSRGVTVVGRHATGLAFKGEPSAAKDARELFTALVGIVEPGAETYGAVAAEGFIWRVCFWLGFIEAVQKQLDPEHGTIPPEALQRITQNAAAPPDVERAADLLISMAQQTGQADAERFKEQAHDTGKMTGMSINVPRYKERP